MNGLTIGLTGGIGSGKSAAADFFAAHGAAIVDADAIAHELTGPGGAAMSAIAQAFGPEALTADGALDRAAMRRLVFADSTCRAKLEAILHPMIRATSEARRETAWANGAPYVMMVIPLLVESPDYPRRFDRVAVVDCPESVQVARVMARNGLSESEVRAIMATQASRAQRLAAADDVIANDQGLEQLSQRVVELHVIYCALAEEKRARG